MALNITKQDAKRALDRLDGLKKRLASVQEQSEAIVSSIVGAAEVTGTALGFGVLQGKTGGVSMLGVPVELIVGGAGLGFAILGGAGKLSEPSSPSRHVFNIATGALAAYTTTLGRGIGIAWRDKSVRTSGELPSGAGVPLSAGATSLSAQEMAHMAAAGIIP